MSSASNLAVQHVCPNLLVGLERALGSPMHAAFGATFFLEGGGGVGSVWRLNFGDVWMH